MRRGVALLLVLGCGGSGGAPDVLPPSGRIVFPPRGAVTEAASVPVSGVAADDRGVASVNVGTVMAVSGNGFLTWSAEVPLANGVNVLAALATDTAGNLAPLPSALVTRTGVVPAGPSAVARAPDGRALVLDATLRVLFLVDLLTGERTLVPDMGPAPAAPSGLAVDGPRALLCDVLVRAVVSLDLATGAWSVISDDITGSGAPLARPQALALVPGGRVAVADAIAAAVVLVDLASGDRTTLAALPFAPVAVAYDASLDRILALGTTALAAVDPLTGAVAPLAGTGPALVSATGLSCDPVSGIAFVTDAAAGAVVSVDPATGDRAIVSDAATGSGTPFSFPRAVAVSGPRLLVVDSIVDALFSVDRTTGERAFLSVAAVGTGAALLAPRDATALGAEALVLDLAQGLVAVDEDGDRRAVSGPAAGSGPPFAAPIGLSTPRNGAVLVADGSAGALFSVDLATGARDVLSAGFLPTDAAFLGARILVTDSALGELLEVDPATGARTTVASGLDLPRSVVVDEAMGRAFVLLVGATPLVSIDVATGAVTPVDAPGLVDPKGLALDAQGRRLFVTDDGSDMLSVVDLASGLLAALPGSGPRYSSPGGVAYDASKGLVFVADAGRGALFAVEPLTGARVIVSK